MAKSRHLNFSRNAPDLTLLDTAGQPVRLSSLWQQRPLLLAFTRHFGCPQCKEMLAELVAGKERIAAAGLTLAVVFQDDPQATAEFADRYAPGVVCLSDERREAYRAYGLERGSLYQLFLNPKVWTATSRSAKKGYKPEMPPEGQDPLQMSGIFVISTQGRIELPYYYDHIADHPTLDLLLTGVLSTRWDQAFDGPVGPQAGS